MTPVELFWTVLDRLSLDPFICGNHSAPLNVVWRVGNGLAFSNPTHGLGVKNVTHPNPPFLANCVARSAYL